MTQNDSLKWNLRANSYFKTLDTPKKSKNESFCNSSMNHDEIFLRVD